MPSHTLPRKRGGRRICQTRSKEGKPIKSKNQERKKNCQTKRQPMKSIEVKLRMTGVAGKEAHPFPETLTCDDTHTHRGGPQDWVMIFLQQRFSSVDWVLRTQDMTCFQEAPTQKIGSENLHENCYNFIN